MNILDYIDDYTKHIKENPYVYTMQKMGIETFIHYINTDDLNINIAELNKKLIDKFLLYWIPKNKKYLSETEAYQLVYTIHDLYQYLLDYKGQTDPIELPAILNIYGEEYIRLYKIRNMLLKMTKDPVISMHPIVIDLMNYKNKKKKNDFSEMATTYEQALFKVQELKEGGQIILTKFSKDKQYKLLLEYPTYKYFKKGDLIQGVIKRRLFYVYWEIEEIKAYYPPEAIVYF